MHEARDTWPWQPWQVGTTRQKLCLQADWSAESGVPLEPAMRESIGRHFDVLVVVWVLALALGWSMAAIARTPTQADWSTTPQSGPVWNFSADVAN
jgi:hypothetical protein